MTMGFFDSELGRLEQKVRRQLESYVQEINQSGGTYHRLDLGNGLVICGDYDMTKYVQHYNLPADLRGKTVLDVGTSSGYFALECARRGARVMGIDIWDSTPVVRIAELLNLEIRYVVKSVYDLDPSIGPFDLVISGSLMLHLPDVVGIIRKIRSVCSGMTVISTACTQDSETNLRPLLEFVGQKAAEADYWTYWSFSAEALKKMLLVCGFSHIESVAHFTLTSEPGRQPFATPHVVISASV